MAVMFKLNSKTNIKNRDKIMTLKKKKRNMIFVQYRPLPHTLSQGRFYSFQAIGLFVVVVVVCFSHRIKTKKGK